MSGCLTVRVTRLAGGLTPRVTRLEGGLTPPSITLATPTMSATIQRREYIENIAISDLNDFPTIAVSIATPPLSVNISSLCSVGVFEKDYEAFYVKEGVFLLVDGKKLKVLKYELSE